LVDPEEDYSSDKSRLPYGIFSYTTALKVGAYMKSVQKPVASFRVSGEAAIGKNRTPIVARFSPRGPNPIVPELLKPDIMVTAPGVNILSAWTGVDPSPTNARRNNNYEVDSGTSMHVVPAPCRRFFFSNVLCARISLSRSRMFKQRHNTAIVIRLADVAALIKKKHGYWTWTSAMIR
jgi:hypothetical protein